MNVDRMLTVGISLFHGFERMSSQEYLKHFTFPSDSTVISDKMVVIGTAQNRSENVFRRLKIFDTTGNELTLLTNRFDLDTDEVAEIYKSRWAIE